MKLHANSNKLTPWDLQEAEALKYSSTLNPRTKNDPGLGTGMLQMSRRHEKGAMTNEDDTCISAWGLCWVAVHRNTSIHF